MIIHSLDKRHVFATLANANTPMDNRKSYLIPNQMFP